MQFQTLRQELEEKFYQGTFMWGPDVTPNDVAALMKQFLRELPVPLLTNEYIDTFAQVESKCFELFNFVSLVWPSVEIPRVRTGPLQSPLVPACYLP